MQTLTVQQIAEIFQLNPKAVYTMIKRRTFPVKPLRLGRTVRFSKKAVEEYMESA